MTSSNSTRAHSIDDAGYWAEREYRLSGQQSHDDAVIVAAANAEYDAATAAEWTLETTTTRRAAWAARVKAGEFTVAGKADMRLVNVAEVSQGWTMASLRAAITRHGL